MRDSSPLPPPPELRRYVTFAGTDMALSRWLQASRAAANAGPEGDADAESHATRLFFISLLLLRSFALTVAEMSQALFLT